MSLITPKTTKTTIKNKITPNSSQILFMLTFFHNSKSFSHSCCTPVFHFIHHSLFIIQYSIFIFRLLYPFSLPAQEWTEPVNISSLGGYSMEPDMVIDNSGVIHVVWTHNVATGHWLILYAKSEDDGMIWTEPIDLLQNPEFAMLQPHIACDSKNNLYVTYTHDGNGITPEGRLIKMLTWNGQQWTEPIVISEGMPGSHYPKILLDDDDTLYALWGYLSNKMYYRYRINNLWSDIYCPYCDSTDWFYFSNGIQIVNSTMYLSGSSLSYYYYGERPQYYIYDIENNSWQNPDMISNDTIVVDIDISLNKSNIPELVYRKISILSSGGGFDATMHTKKEGLIWLPPELVSGIDKQQIGQQIAIDQNNDVHVVETEYYVSTELETELVHYYRLGNTWLSQPIDCSDNLCNYPKLLFSNKNLYVVYWWHSEELEEGHIRFSKYDIISNLKEELKPAQQLKIYPNPGGNNIIVEFENSKNQHINLSIFDMTGINVVTIANKIFPPGRQRILWNGTDKNGKEVGSGSYLVRLVSGRKSVSQIVEIIR